jgi:hypothetical protein
MEKTNFFLNGRRPQFLEYGRRPQFFLNGRQPSFFLIEDDLRFLIWKPKYSFESNDLNCK